MLVRISLVVAVTLLAGCKAPSLVVGVMSQSVVDAGVVAETLPSMGDAFAFDVPRPGVAHITDFSVAFDGQQHLAAWTNTSGVWAVHFSAEGTLLDAAPIQLAPPALVTGAIETLALPGGFVVVWGNGAVPVVATVMNGRHSAPTVVSSARLPGTVQQIHFAGISNGCGSSPRANFVEMSIT